MVAYGDKKLKAVESFVSTRLLIISKHFLKRSCTIEDNMEDFRKFLEKWKNDLSTRSVFTPTVSKEDLNFGSTETFTSEEVSDTLSYDGKCEIEYIDEILDYMTKTDNFDDVKEKLKKDIEKFKKEVEEKGKVEYDDLINGTY